MKHLGFLRSGFKLAHLAAIAVIFIGTLLTTIAVQREQDIRSSAQSRACRYCDGDICRSNSDSSCIPGANECESNSDCVTDPEPPPDENECEGDCIRDDVYCEREGRGDCPSGRICCLEEGEEPPPPDPEPQTLCEANGNNCFPNSFICESEPPFDCNVGYKCGINCSPPEEDNSCPQDCVEPGTECDREGVDYECTIGGFICCLDGYVPPPPPVCPEGTCINEAEFNCVRENEDESIRCGIGEICCEDYLWQPPPEEPKDYGFCAEVNGYPRCEQNNPLWADEPFPGGCYTGDTDNHWYKMGCGQSVSASILCEYVDDRYCDVRVVMDEHYSTTTCGGTSWLTHKQVFDKFPGDIEYGTLKPPFSKEKLIYHLDRGRTILVGGQFVPNTGSGSKSHFSYVVGHDGDKLIFADPFFHENYYEQVNEYLEDYYTVTLEEAYVITDASSDRLDFGE